MKKNIFDGTPENFLSKESPKIFPLLVQVPARLHIPIGEKLSEASFGQLLSREAERLNTCNLLLEILTVFGSICCCQRGELSLLQATVNVKLRPPLSLYFGFRIRLVVSILLHISEYFSVI